MPKLEPARDIILRGDTIFEEGWRVSKDMSTIVLMGQTPDEESWSVARTRETVIEQMRVAQAPALSTVANNDA